MKTFLIVSGIILSVMMLIPLINVKYWWIRIFDFPKVQITVPALIILLVLFFKYSDNRNYYDIGLMVLLGGCIIYQAFLIYPYTPFSRKQTGKSTLNEKNRHISILESNILISNKNTDKLLDLVKKTNPDIILLMEVDDYWDQKMKVLEKEYPFTILKPLPNSYGINMYSRFKLIDPKINFLIKDDIPSICTKIALPSGEIIDFFGVHPEPPVPTKDADERDAEIIMVAKKVKKANAPTIVAGDLNDVAWSHTTRLFQRISGMLDPRVGRGSYNTFNAKIPLFRYPLDHIFHTKEFRLVKLERMENIGSDHFPMFIKLSYEPHLADTVEIPKPEPDDHAEANEKIRAGLDKD